MSRKYIDCPDMQSDSNRDLTMAGSEELVGDAAGTHAS